METPRKHAVLVTPASFANGATASGYVDTRGYDYLEVEVTMATANVVSNSPSVLKLMESDDTETTNFANISGAVGGTDFTIGNHLTSLPNQHVFGVSLRGRKRYIRCDVSPRTTQIASITAQLGTPEEAPVTAAKAGVQTVTYI
jgi:hypothetical protein